MMGWLRSRDVSVWFAVVGLALFWRFGVREQSRVPAHLLDDYNEINGFLGTIATMRRLFLLFHRSLSLPLDF